MDEKYSALKLKILDRFKCIGGDCVQSCCIDWKIDFSLKEYEKISERNRFGKRLDGFFKDFEANGVKKKRIALDKDGLCPFLDESRLCSLQLKCGEEFMSKTCRVFPRMTVKYGNVFERTLSTGCEEVVRMLLEEKDGLELDEEQNISREKELNYVNDTVINIGEKVIKERPVLSYWFDMKFLGLSILQDRSYTMEQRMLLLGIAMKHIDEFEKNDNIVEIHPYINAFVDNVSGGKLKKQLCFAKNNDDVKEIKIKTIIYQTAILTYKEHQKSTIFDYIRKKLDIDEVSAIPLDNNEKDDSKKTYRFTVNTEYNKEVYSKCEEYYNRFIKDNEYFIENFMVANYLFLNVPFKDEKSTIFDNYKMFVALFTTFKFCIATYMDDTKTTDDLIYLTVAISRSLSHGSLFITNSNEILNSMNIETIAQLAVLLM